MTTEAIAEPEPVVEPVGTVTDEQLIAMLVDRARGDGLRLTGEGGLLQQLTKRVLESALDGEITDHVGYGKHDRAGRGSGNSRNGSRTKTVLTEAGPVEIAVPRDATRPGATYCQQRNVTTTLPSTRNQRQISAFASAMRGIGVRNSAAAPWPQRLPG